MITDQHETRSSNCGHHCLQPTAQSRALFINKERARPKLALLAFHNAVEDASQSSALPFWILSTDNSAKITAQFLEDRKRTLQRTVSARVFTQYLYIVPRSSLIDSMPLCGSSMTCSYCATSCALRQEFVARLLRTIFTLSSRRFNYLILRRNRLYSLKTLLVGRERSFSLPGSIILFQSVF